MSCMVRKSNTGRSASRRLISARTQALGIARRMHHRVEVGPVSVKHGLAHGRPGPVVQRNNDVTADANDFEARGFLIAVIDPLPDGVLVRKELAGHGFTDDHRALAQMLLVETHAVAAR